uniref:Imidazolonepropionase n=1 Tax=uncultured Latescibacterota bacterium TaxID=199737 RepID=Q2Z0D0_9BACT|nr:imidazolone-5-propionate hydrolase [uncultured Latescibacterota bacterium]
MGEEARHQDTDAGLAGPAPGAKPRRGAAVGGRVADLVVRNIGQLVTLAGSDGPRRGAEMRELALVECGAVASEGGRVLAAGREADVLAAVGAGPDTVFVDADGGVVTPGLVDPHTHAVFAATREDEFAMRVEGRSYEEIAEAGGGIRSSVRTLRATDPDSLRENGRGTLDRMLQFGTTMAEVKSGYGLSLESELKMLRVISELEDTHAVDVVPTFLGAHEFPDEWRDDRDGYVDHLIDVMIPAVAAEKLARFCDVFCEEGVFTVEQSRRVLTAARAHGMEPKLHADELHAFGAAELAAELGAASADHLVCASDDGIAALAAAGVVAVLLPGTTLSLGSRAFAPARKMIDAGVPVALATDCNPGSSMTESMQIILALASMMLRMTPAEALVAATVNAAAALRAGRVAGSLTPGRQCDLVIWEVDDYRAIPYHYGVNLVASVVKRGSVVVSRGASGAGAR